MIPFDNKELDENAEDPTQKTFDEKSRVASSMDCTGLVPFGVSQEAQSDAYHELFDIIPPKPEEGLYDKHQGGKDGVDMT